MMETYSSTPWHLRQPIEADPAVIYWLDSADGVPIADIKANNYSAQNAALLAHAPDLLAACEFAADFIESNMGATNMGAAKIRAAIAKAKGIEKATNDSV